MVTTLHEIYQIHVRDGNNRSVQGHSALYSEEKGLCALRAQSPLHTTVNGSRKGAVKIKSQNICTGPGEEEDTLLREEERSRQCQGHVASLQSSRRFLQAQSRRKKGTSHRGSRQWAHKGMGIP